MVMSYSPICKEVKYGALAAGALTAYTGMDRTIAALPPAAHYALAGLAVESWDRFSRKGSMGVPLDTAGACAAAYGYAGAMALPFARQLLGRAGISF